MGRIVQNTVLEFCDDNLENVIGTHQRLNNPFQMGEIKKYMKGILNGLANMHKIGIVHRDLKPENILLKNGDAKICVFGSSKFLDRKNHKNTPYVVSRYYRAPELILSSIYYDETIDIWAAGCIFFEFLTLMNMFPGESEGLQVYEMICLLGMPTSEELRKMSEKIDERAMGIIKRIDFQVPYPDMKRLIGDKIG
jgi:glycogen synthase kinase 3 beta